MTGIVEWLIITLILLVALAAVVYIAFWILGQMGVPEPMNKLLRIVMGVIGLLLLFAIILERGFP